jgi:hypothetical protein
LMFRLQSSTGPLERTLPESLARAIRALARATLIVSVPADAGLFRNVVPKAVEEFVKTDQKEAWEKRM